MLNKNDKKLLKYMISLDHDSDFPFKTALFPDDIERISKRINISTNEYRRCVNHLHEIGYIGYLFSISKDGVERDPIGFMLTYDGYNYEKIRKHELFDFFVGKILLPIVISVMSAVITATLLK